MSEQGFYRELRALRAECEQIGRELDALHGRVRRDARDGRDHERDIARVRGDVAILDEPDGGFDEDERAIGRAMAAFARGEDDWWAGCYDT